MAQYTDKYAYKQALIDEAARLIDLGFSIVLIHTRFTDYGTGKYKNKTPVPGARSGTRDLTRIKQLLQARAEGAVRISYFNFGLAIAIEDNFCVIDDDRGGDGFREMIAACHWDSGKTHSMATETPRGYHVFLRTTAPFRSVKLRLVDGVDVKGAGGYVICPPTQTEVGGYTWNRDPRRVEDMLPASDYFHEKFMAKPKADRAEFGEAWSASVVDVERAKAALFNKLSESDNAVPCGERNHFCFQAAALLFDYGLGERAALRLMYEIVKPRIQSPIDDPFDDQELEQCVRSGLEFRQEEVGSRTMAGMGFEVLEGAEEPKAPDTFDLDLMPYRDAHDTLTEPAMHWTVTGCLPAGAAAAIMAPSGSHKTNVALALAYAIAVGAPAFGGFEIPKACKVFYVDLEGGLGFSHRVAATLRHHKLELPRGQLLLWPREDLNGNPVPAFSLRSKEHVDELIKFCRGFGLIVIDTFSRAIAGADENSAEDMGAVIQQIDRLARATGACVLLITHTPKSGVRTIRGSGSLDAAMNVRFSVEVEDSGKILFHMDHNKDAISNATIIMENVVGDGIVLKPRSNATIFGPRINEPVCKTLWQLLGRGAEIATTELQRILITDLETSDRTARRWLKAAIGTDYNGGLFVEPKYGFLAWKPHLRPTSIKDMLG